MKRYKKLNPFFNKKGTIMNKNNSKYFKFYNKKKS